MTKNKSSFQKGNKGGPGRPKGSLNGSAVAKEWVDARGFDLLIRIADGTEPGFKKSIGIRGKVAMYLVDRAYGKPTQAHELGGACDQPHTLVDFLAMDDKDSDRN